MKKPSWLCRSVSLPTSSWPRSPAICRKPDGFVVVEPDRIQEFLDPLPVERLWGVGRQGSKVFQRLGIRTISQLRQWPVEMLQRHFGSQGEHLWQLAHGIDHRQVVPEREAKSISHETTFETDIDDQEVLRAWLLDLTEQVGWRLRRHELRGRVIHLKVRFADFSTITRSQTLPEPTDITDELWQVADRCSASDFRLIIFRCDCWEWASAVWTHPA